MGHVDVRRLVHPVLEHLPALRGVGDHRARMGPETGEQGKLLTTHQDIDGVDLDEPHPIEHLSEVAPINPPVRTRVGETLRAEGNSPWYTCAHDEFALVMDGDVEVHLVKLDTDQIVADENKNRRMRRDCLL